MRPDERSPTPPRAASARSGDAPPNAPFDDASLIKLTAGQIFASVQPRTIVTMLGSCVSVCLYDDTTGIGGASHFVEPLGEPDAVDPLRFGNVAINALLERLMRLGAKRHYLAAKIIGGAQMGSDAEPGSVGAANIDIARQVLHAERIPVHTEETGGQRGRQLHFATANGTAWVRVL
jgi:chemotaxis protein CheD